MESRKVNLFVVGAMRAGTTSFMELLSKHPQVYTSPIKEPNYFVDELPKNFYTSSRFFNIDAYFKNDFPAFIHSAKVEEEIHYKKLFSLAQDKKYLAEGSTAYLHAPECAKKIYNYNQNSTIIILVRNPLQRAFSHYKMDLGLGRVRKSFETVIKKEIILYKENRLPWNSYIGMSSYNKPINNYKKLFNKVLIIDFEEFVTTKMEILNNFAIFLEIEPFSIIGIDNKNKTKTLRFQKLLYLLKQLGLKDYFSFLFSSSLKMTFFNLIIKNKDQPLHLSPKVKQEIEVLFEKEIQD